MVSVRIPCGMLSDTAAVSYRRATYGERYQDPVTSANCCLISFAHCFWVKMGSQWVAEMSTHKGIHAERRNCDELSVTTDRSTGVTYDWQIRTVTPYKGV